MSQSRSFSTAGSAYGAFCLNTSTIIPITVHMSQSRRGFTLLEVIIVSAIIATVAAIILPSFQLVTAKARLRTAARDFMATVANIRSTARSGMGNITGWSADARVKEAGVRWLNDTTYETFIDSDDVVGNGNEITIGTTSLNSRYKFTLSQNELRFRRNGTLSTELDITATFEDTSLAHIFTVTTTYGGRSRMTASSRNP